jgi:hypothetical protein
MAKMNPFMAMIAKKKETAKAPKKMATGGMTSMGRVPTGSGIDGVATKGKTKGKQVAMKRGGKC